MFYTYACHPTSKAGNNVSADYPGEISRGLKRELGENVLTLFAQGAGGSVMPRQGCHTEEDKAHYAQYWHEVAADIARFLRSEKMRPLDLRIRAVEKEFLIPYDERKMPSRAELMTYADPNEPTVDRYISPANRRIVRLWAAGILEKMRTDSLDSGFTMHATRITLSGDVQVIGLSGEVTAEVGRIIKDAFPDWTTIFLGYCSYTDAYIPTAEMLPRGGLEALASIYFHMRPAPFVAEIDECLNRELLSLEV